MAQPRVYESMLAAKNTATAHQVELLAVAVEPKDLEVLPASGFIKTPLLQRNLASFDPQFSRPLPFFADLAQAALAASDAEVFVYTNCDIGLTRHFYEFIAAELDDLDAVVINRRTIPDSPRNRASTLACLSAVGKTHPGFDCFVFSRRMLEKGDFGLAVVGGNWIGRVLLVNVFAQTRRFHVHVDKHLTFHLGDDRAWSSSESLPVHRHNESALLDVCDRWLERTPLCPELIEDLVQTHRHGRPLKFDGGYVNAYAVPTNALRSDPLFVVGFPRSGTTLAQLLMGAQGFLTTRETHFFRLLKEAGLDHEEWLSHGSATQLLAKVATAVGYELSDVRVPQEGLAPQDLFERVMLWLLQSQSDGDPQTKRWMEKTPDHCKSLQIIKHWYPRARVICMVRSPVAALDSWRRVAGGWGAAPKSIVELCRAWRESLLAARQFKIDYPNDLMFVRLDDLQVNPVAVTQKMCRFAGIPFDRARVEQRKQIAAVAVGGNERWKKAAADDIQQSEGSPLTALTSSDQALIQVLLQDLMQEFGFAVDDAAFAQLEKADLLEALRDDSVTSVEPGLRRRLRGLLQAVRLRWQSRHGRSGRLG